MLIANSCLDIRNRWWNEACVLSGSGVRGQRLNCDLRGGYERPVGEWYPQTARHSFTKTSNKCVFPRRERNVLSHVRPNLHFWKAKSVRVIWDRRPQLIPPTGTTVWLIRYPRGTVYSLIVCLECFLETHGFGEARGLFTHKAILQTHKLSRSHSSECTSTRKKNKKLYTTRSLYSSTE